MQITKEKITELENKLAEAIKNNDVGFLNKVLHDELLFLTPNGQMITKAMDLASHRSGEMIVEQLLSRIEDINIIDDTAVVAIVYDAKGSMLGNPIEGQFRYIRIWKQFPEGLQIIGGACIQV